VLLKKVIINSDLKFDFYDLMRYVDLDHSFTLEDVINACMNSQIDMNVLCAILQCPFIKEYYEEMSKPLEEDDDGLIECLELCFSLERHVFEGKHDDASYWSFHGLGKEGVLPDDYHKVYSEKEINELIENKHRIGYAIEYTPVNEIKHLEIRISDSVCFTDWSSTGDSIKEQSINCKPSIKLLDLLYEIFYELSYAGSIEDRKKNWAEISKRVEQYKSYKEDKDLDK
jgi:hypothetical protein